MPGRRAGDANIGITTNVPRGDDRASTRLGIATDVPRAGVGRRIVAGYVVLVRWPDAPYLTIAIHLDMIIHIDLNRHGVTNE